MVSDGSRPVALEGRDLRVRYGDAIALDGVDIDLPRGRISALVGHNGSGKSTVIKAVAGVVASRGRIRLDGTDLSDLSAYQRSKQGISLAPQTNQVFPRLSIIDNLRVFATSRRLHDAEIDIALDRFPVLRERARRLAGVLSGGERQMLSISRALMGQPSLLLIDELTAGLAHGIIREITDFISGLVDDGLTVLCAEPNLAPIQQWVQGGYVLQRGLVVGTAEGGKELHDLSRTRLGITV